MAMMDELSTTILENMEEQNSVILDRLKEIEEDTKEFFE
jgi:hypothetical protein